MDSSAPYNTELVENLDMGTTAASPLPHVGRDRVFPSCAFLAAPPREAGMWQEVCKYQAKQNSKKKGKPWEPDDM